MHSESITVTASTHSFQPVSYRLLVRDAMENHAPSEVFSRGFPFSILSPSLPPNPFLENTLSVSSFPSSRSSLVKMVSDLLKSDLEEQQSLRDTLLTHYRHLSGFPRFPHFQLPRKISSSPPFFPPILALHPLSSQHPFPREHPRHRPHTDRSFPVSLQPRLPFPSIICCFATWNSVFPPTPSPFPSNCARTCSPDRISPTRCVIIVGETPAIDAESQFQKQMQRFVSHSRGFGANYMGQLLLCNALASVELHPRGGIFPR